MLSAGQWRLATAIAAVSWIALPSMQEGSASKQPTDTQGAAQWTVAKETSLIDDSLTVTVSTQSGDEIEGWPDKRARPRLIIRHKEGAVEAFVETGFTPHVEESAKPSQATCTVRFDKEEAVTLQLGQSTNRTALFFSASKRWIKTMLRSDRLVFRFTPFNSSPQVCVFDLHGLQEALIPLHEASGWWIGSFGDRFGDALAGSSIVTSVMGYTPASDMDDMDLDLNILPEPLTESKPYRELAWGAVADVIARALTDDDVKEHVPSSLRIVVEVAEKGTPLPTVSIKSELRAAMRSKGVSLPIAFKQGKSGPYPVILLFEWDEPAGSGSDQ